MIQQGCILGVVNYIQQKGEVNMTDTEQLKKAIEDSGVKISWILEKMGIKSYTTLRDKIENRQEFKASEIAKLCEILHLDANQMNKIFFTVDAEYHSA